MSKINLTEVIKSVKQPTFDDEMIRNLIDGLDDTSKSYYSFIQRQNRVISGSGEIDRKAEQELWQKKSLDINRETISDIWEVQVI